MTQQVEAVHAPNVEPAWATAFVKEARLHDVPNSVIDSALNEVDVNVQDSGRSAQDLYGDPVAYATELGESAMPAPLALVASAIGPLLMQILGVLLIAFSVFSPAHEGIVPITWGTIFGFALMALLYFTLASRTLCTWVMRGLMARPIVSIVSVLVYLGVTAYLSSVPGVYFTVPTAVLIPLGAVLVGIGFIWGVMRGNAHRSRAPELADQKGGVFLPYLVIPAIALMLLIVQLFL